MTGFPTIKVPAYEFYFNLVVCPNPYGVKNVSLYFSYYVYKQIFNQGSSTFVLLSITCHGKNLFSIVSIVEVFLSCNGELQPYLMLERL